MPVTNTTSSALPPQPRRSPAPSFVDRLRLFVTAGEVTSASGAVALMFAGVNPMVASWLGLIGAAATGWFVLELAIARIRSLTAMVLQLQTVDPDTFSPEDRLAWLEMRARLQAMPLDGNEQAELRLLQRARAARWICRPRTRGEAVPKPGVWADTTALDR